MLNKGESRLSTTRSPGIWRTRRFRAMGNKKISGLRHEAGSRLLKASENSGEIFLKVRIS